MSQERSVTAPKCRTYERLVLLRKLPLLVLTSMASHRPKLPLEHIACNVCSEVLCGPKPGNVAEWPLSDFLSGRTRPYIGDIQKRYNAANQPRRFLASAGFAWLAASLIAITLYPPLLLLVIGNLPATYMPKNLSLP